MLRRVWYMMRKEFIQVWRDRRLRIFLFLPPLFQIIVYGYATNFDLKHVPTAIFDEAHSSESQDLINRFGASEYFSLRASIDSETQLRSLIDRGEVSLALHFPPDFAAQIKAGHTARLQLIIDATDSNAALIVAKYSSSILQDFSQQLLRQRYRHAAGRGGLETPVVVESRVWFNPNMVSQIAFVPGVIAIVVMLVGLMLTALAVVREKELGTLEQVMVTPIKPLEFLLGKTVPFILIALGDVVLVTLFALYWFELPFRGSPLVLLIGTLTFLFSAVGLGLLISTVSRTEQQALMGGTFLLTPAIMLSGLIFPIANMPKIFQYITYVNPLRYFMTVVQSIFLKGVGLADLWPEMASMSVLGLAMLGFSIFRFRRRSTFLR
jgi:ABC-2 type transport system permease protein